jgi:predicted RNA-binding protein YlxR (DUF448 family)
MTSERTCVACGARGPKSELRRFVRDAEELRLDPTQSAPGRGAYLHDDAECTKRFARGRGPVRTLRWAPSASARAVLAASVADASRGPR